MASPDFPDDLVTAQLHLHQAWADLETLGRTLPWVAVPMAGYTSAHRTIDPETGELRNKVFPDSPGYSPEQSEQVAALWARIRELSVTVGTHPYRTWDCEPACCGVAYSAAGTDL